MPTKKGVVIARGGVIKYQPIERANQGMEGELLGKRFRSLSPQQIQLKPIEISVVASRECVEVRVDG
jgi:hypothetical protein